MNSCIEVLYEDNHLLILNKPAGLLTQPSGTEQDSLEKQAKDWIQKKYQKPGNVFLEAIHRLDKPVSGIVVFAKTSKALSRLNASIRAKQTKKIYWALIEGALPSQEGTLEHYLFHDDYCARVVSKEDKDAKLCRLHYRVKEKQNSFTLIEIELETGRYHQIRSQLSHISCPIVGDKKYKSSYSFKENTITLHHRQLVIEHPVLKTELIIEAPCLFGLSNNDS
ncbi:MAG: RNA pseudouridine synthase [Parachlamydiaceae bacterium]|nr:RNA pseudouridine synthase [Parachlamydiaceae bacterium]